MRILTSVALLCAAVVFGLTLSHVLQAPGSRDLDAAAWLAVQHAFYGGFAIVGGAAEVAGVIAAAIVAVRLWHRHRTQALAHLAAALCLAGTLASYAVGNRPVNGAVAGWTARTVPPDWPSFRDQWEAAHAVSAALSGAALIVLIATAVWHPPGGPAARGK